MADAESGQPKGVRKSIPHWRLVAEQGIVTQDILDWKYKGAGTEEDPFVVTWIDNDPRNPMLWSEWKKWSITFLVAIATLAVAFVSSAFSGGVDQILSTFRFVRLGFCDWTFDLGAAVRAFGRQVLYIGTYGVLTAFNAGAAGSQNIQTLIILRFFAGAFGSSPLTNAGGVIADMFAADERGLAMSLFAAAPFMGPVLGPIVGGFVGESIGWRWVEGVMAIFTGVLWLLGMFLIPETYPQCFSMTGKVYLSQGDVEQGKKSFGEVFRTSLLRPWVLLFREPIVLLLSIYMAIIYGTLYMLFGAFPIVYQVNRGWSEGIGGLAFMGIAVGMLAAVSYSIWDNKRYVKINEAHDGFAPPESRLPPCLIGGICIPVGLFWFAWTNSPSIHWIVSILAGVPFGFGMVLVFLSIMNYLIDSYTIFAASVLAANSMYSNLGIHWASTIPAFLALACVPFPFLFYKYGARIRAKCKFAAQSDAFMRRLMQGAKAGESKEKQEEEEQSAFDYSYESESHEEKKEKEIESQSQSDNHSDDEPRFETIKTAADTNNGGLQRTRSYEGNPYDIDRVNTRDSFAGDAHERRV
ncbi:hypothetical protein H2203_002968 [Taxawa tesnikishii (nom. ined.)]|nr:hypothetical protein H2203_002968 [Dothideales sp. JES 119]